VQGGASLGIERRDPVAVGQLGEGGSRRVPLGLVGLGAQVAQPCTVGSALDGRLRRGRAVTRPSRHVASGPPGDKPGSLSDARQG
jgi:hypothetical protein